MKKNIKIIVIMFCFGCILLTGCGKADVKKQEANQSVSNIKYYVPNDYKLRNDLRGILYNDESRKVFAKGDKNDYSSFEYIDMIKTKSDGKSLLEYIDEVNTKNLKDGDVKFFKINHSELEIYGREGYMTKQGDIEIINYAYLIAYQDDYYGLTISGPNSKKDELKSLSNEIIESLQKKG